MINVVKKTLALLSPREKRHLYLIFFGLVCMAMLEMAGIASILPFMAVVSNPGIVETNKWLNAVYVFFEFENITNFLFFLGVIALGFLFFSNGLKAMMSWLMVRFDNNLNYSLSRKLLAVYLNRPYPFFLNRNTAEMGKNILTEARVVITNVVSRGMKFLSGCVTTLFILGLLVLIDPILAIIIIIVLGGSYAVIYSLARAKLARISREQLEANKMKYKTAGEALSGIKDLKVLGREREFLDRFAIHALRHARNNIFSGVISQLPRYALEVVAFGGILLIVLYFLGANQEISRIVPLLALYAYAGYRILPALQEIFASVATVRSSLASLDLLHRDLIEEKSQPDTELSLEKQDILQPLPFCQKLDLRKVSFQYPGALDCALKDIDLSIRPNSTIGLVGSTGSGKTTMVDLILGLLKPISGKILVDGVEVNSDNLARWQCNLGYVPQHIYLCDDTVTRNIAFGVPDSEINMEQVLQSARIANLNEFIESDLPKGYETDIGERGIRLSGGQRQRIGIARALYRDPAVLIMDEATSALDGVTEQAVMEAIQTLSGKKTIILIAHRLTTVKDCDAIYQLEHGRIVNQGSYQELQKSSRWFYSSSSVRL